MLENIKDYESIAQGHCRAEQKLSWSAGSKMVSLFIKYPIPYLNTSLLVLRCRFKSKYITKKIFVGTHHKVLTNYFRRIFLVYSFASGRRFSLGRHFELDVSADIIFDHHSESNLSRIGDVIGLHVRRDPRDLIVSCAHYHVVAQEPWLDVPCDEFGGLSYRDKISSYASLQDRMLFEIDHVGGYNIKNMIDWSYDKRGIAELKYEDIVQTGGRSISSQLEQLQGLTNMEQILLSNLAIVFSSTGPFKHRKHIRDVRTAQWREAFTDTVTQRFASAFPTALDTLGYRE